MISSSEDKNSDYLKNGQVDLLASNQINTSHFENEIMPTAPIHQDAIEIVVTRKGSKLNNLDELSGKTIAVRERSHGLETLENYNHKLKSKKLAPIKIEVLDENISTQYILEIVNSGLLPEALTRKYFAQVWSGVYKDLVLNSNFPLSQHQSVHWLVNKKSVVLLKHLNTFINRT